MSIQAATETAALEPLPFSAIQGWAADNQADALAAFRRSCSRILGATEGDPLVPACRAVAEVGEGADKARSFFEAYFEPHRVLDGGRPTGLFTGYFEPDIRASRTREVGYEVPLLAPPADLVALGRSRNRGTVPRSFSHALLRNGSLQVAPTRAEIEDGALSGQADVVAWVADPIDAFFLHVQGSGRLRYPDGSSDRVSYAGKNGHPYTSIGRVLVDRGEMTREQVTMQSLRDWMGTDPQRASELMRENRSYIFFRIAGGRSDEGPIGQQQVPLTPGRSLAIDLAYHRTGLPIWLDTRVPTGDGAMEPFRRLMIAQDTGSAIRGPVRGDIFFGSGDAAGVRAGAMREQGAMIVLLPRPTPAGDR